MKLPVIRKIRKEDLGADVPGWVDRMLSPMNQFIEQVGVAITGRLTFEENMSGKIINQSFTHNVALEISLQDSRDPLGIMPIYSQGQNISAYGWERLDNGNISITLQFASGSGTASSRVLVIYK